MNTAIKFPFFVKISILLVGVYVFFSMLSIGGGIILPILYALIIAILVSPVVKFLVRRGINRTVSILLVLVISILFIASAFILVLSQASLLIDALPQLIEKFQMLLSQAVSGVSLYFNIRVELINEWIASAKVDILSNRNAAIGFTLTTVGGLFTTVFLTPVYIFMLLFYQPHLVEAIHRVFGTNNDLKVSEILLETKSIIQSYLVGLFLEFLIIALLNSTGLLILGLDYAILLGVMGALLNVIPYLGGLMAVILYMIIALVTKEPVYVIYVLSLYLFVQFVDNNYIVPKIVGSKVKLNALVCLLAVIGGASLWGIPGMFLAIPLLAIVKLILDRITELKPLGFLLGDTMPPIIKFIRVKKPPATGIS